jgi:hypothetical protein
MVRLGDLNSGDPIVLKTPESCIHKQLWLTKQFNGW